MATPSLATRTALTIGIAGSATTAGIGIAISYLAIPAILQSPNKALIAQQWRSIYNKGINLVPPLAILSSATLAYLSYNAYTTGDGGDWVGFAVAAAAAVAIIPFTLATMLGVNAQLMKESERQKGDEGGLKEGEVRDLVERWTMMNWIRSLPPLGAALIGLWTASSKAC